MLMAVRQIQSALRARFEHSKWPPPIVLIPAVLVCLLLLLSPAYLTVRTLESGVEAWDLLFRLRVLQILLRTLGLVFSVTLASVALAVPLAWLIVRTDLPLRRMWRVVLPLPLVVPSYVGALVVVAALGPRGMLQGLLQSLFGIELLPDLSGFPGAFLVLTLLSYPYVLLTVQAALWRMDPALEESSSGLGYSGWATFRKIALPLLRPAIASGTASPISSSSVGATSARRPEANPDTVAGALTRTVGTRLVVWAVCGLPVSWSNMVSQLP